MTKPGYSPLDLSAEFSPDQKLKASDLDFYTLLRRQSDAGKLFFNQRRSVLFDVGAIGNLRQQLVEALGQQTAAGILMQLGYSQGYQAAEALTQNFNWASEQDWLLAGSTLPTLAGMVQAQPDLVEVDRESGHFYMRGVWHNSYEAQEHLSRFGRSNQPVCWTLAGYASGYASRFFGQDVLAIETECVGMGHPHCRWQIKPVAAWGDEAQKYLGLLQTNAAAVQNRLAFVKVLEETGPAIFTRWQATAGWPVEFVSGNVRQLGLDPAVLTAPGFSYLSLIHPDDREPTEQLAQDNAANGIDQFDHDYRLINPAGEVRWVNTQISAQRNPHGQVTHYAGVSLDVTERKQSEGILHRLAIAVEQSANTVVITDNKGHVEYANPRFSQTTGYSLEEAMGQHTRILKSGETSDTEYKNLWETISKGKVWRGEFHNKTKSGDLYWESASISPITNERGQITHYLAIKEDITARKHAQLALAHRVVELETVSKVGAAASNILNVNELLHQVVNLTRDGFELYHVNIYLLGEPDDTLTLAAASGSVGQQILETRLQIPYLHQHSPVAQAAREQQGVIVDDITTQPGYVPNPLLPDTRSYMAVPIVSGNTLYGVLNAHSGKVAHFTQDDLSVYFTLTNQIAVAIKNARLYENISRAQQEAEARLHEMRILQQITQSLGGALHTSEVIDAFMTACTRLLSFQFAIFSLVDESQQRVKAVAGYNVADDHLKRASHPLDSDNIMAEIVRTGKTDVIFRSDPRFSAASFKIEGMANLGMRVFTPITLRDKHIGLVEVGFNEFIDETTHQSQLRLLRSLIDQTALALENAFRFESARQIAQREQVLRQVTASIRSSADVNSVMRTAALEIGRVMGRKSFVYLGQQSNGPDKDD